MSYKIKYSSKDQFYTMATSKFNDWSAELARVQHTLNAISGMGKFRGESAESVKSYFDEVHGFLLLGLRQVINDFYSRLATFSYGYYDIDDHMRAVLPEEDFYSLQDLATAEQGYLRQENGNISGTLYSIADILPLNVPSQANLIAAFDDMKGQLDALNSRISSYESQCQSEANGQLGALIGALSASVTASKKARRIVGYHSGDYGSYPDTKELFQQIAVSLQATTANNKIISERLDNGEHVMVSYNQDNVITPNLSTVAELLNQSNLSIDDLAKAGLIPALVGAVIGSIGVSISPTDESRTENAEDTTPLGDKWHDSVWSSEGYKTGEFLGIGTNGKTTAEFLSASAEYGGHALFETDFDENGKPIWDEFEIGAGVTGKVEGHLLTGEAAGNWGYLNGKGEAAIGNVGVEGEAGITLFEDGKFAPSLNAEASAKASVLEVDGEVSFGSDNNNVHVQGDATVLGAEASAEGNIGRITIEDESGNTEVVWGVKGEAKAEAYIAEGSVEGGFSIFGIDIDIGVEGKLGGAGVGVGGHATSGGVSGSVDLGLGVGAGLEISIDWSDFEWPFSWP